MVVVYLFEIGGLGHWVRLLGLGLGITDVKKCVNFFKTVLRRIPELAFPFNFASVVMWLFYV